MSASCDDFNVDHNNVLFLSLNSVQSSLTLTQSRPELTSSVRQSQIPTKIYRKDLNLDAAQLLTIVCVKDQLCLCVQMLEVFSFVVVVGFLLLC